MKINVITAFYKGNEYIYRYISCMSDNAKALEEEGHCLEVVIVNDSPDVEVELPYGYDAVDVDGANSMKDEGGGSGGHKWRVSKRCPLSKRSNITIVTQPVNMGIHSARVAGLEASDGEYVMFLDQDDTISDNALLRHVQTVERRRQNSAWIAGTAGVDSEEGDIFRRIHSPVTVSNARLEQSDGRMKLWYRTDYHKRRIGDLNAYINIGVQIVSPGQCLIPREYIPGMWQTDICRSNGSDDYYLWLLLLGDGHPFVFIDENLYTHRYTGDNLSSDTTATDESIYEFAEYIRRTDVITGRELGRLIRMTAYKAGFRSAGIPGKIMLSMKNMDLFIKNIIFKIRSKTPLGFNR